MPVRTHAWLWGSLCWALMSDPEESPGKSSLRQGATSKPYTTIQYFVKWVVHYHVL